MKQNNLDQRVGFHSIESILKHNPEKLKKITLPAKRADKRIESLIKLIESKGIAFELSKKISQEPEAIIKKEEQASFQDLKLMISNSKNKNPLILILDNIIDPRNMGACIRSAAVLNIDAIVINKHHCAPLNEVVHNVSAGGVEVVKIFNVSNLINCIKYLKDLNINIFGLSEHADKNYLDENFKESCALVMGSEESGIRTKTSENCNSLIGLSGNKNFKSFNVSVATGIILSEVLRQRRY